MRTIAKRILIAVPLVLGISLFTSSVFSLLDAYGAAEEYRRMVDPIVDGYVRQGEEAELSTEERIDLASELFFIRVEMDHGSHRAMRFRLFGGLALLAIGAWVVHRTTGWFEGKGDSGAPRASKEPAERTSEGDA